MRKLPLEDEYSNEMKVASSMIPLSSSKKSTSVRTPVAVPVQPESQTPLKSKTVSARAGAALNRPTERKSAAIAPNTVHYS